MNPQVASILANAQALANQIAAYAASLTPPGGTVPQNVAAALSAVTTAFNTLTADAAANPFVLATVVTDVANLLSAVNTLTSAAVSPSNP